jgi:2-polyprenyl-3-methyl-5-hydroxy-6-metoxy-1,4-benzoquinol methylase
MASRYFTQVDPDSVNAHGLALAMVGWNKRVLELGAADGHMTAAMAARNCRVTAVEYMADCAADLKAVAEEVVVGDLNDPTTLGSIAAQFEVILAGDVLEHLLNPRQVLIKMVDLLEPGGRIVISLPNVAHVDLRLALLEGRFDYGPWGLLDDTHVRFFTLKSIHEMVRSAGLTIVDLQRVRVPAFESELGVDRQAVPTNVLNRILSDPEAETYQFVFTAVKDDASGTIAQMAEDYRALKADYDDLVVARQVAEVQAAALQRRVRALESKVTVVRAQRDAARASIRTIPRRKVMRYSAPVRAVYGRYRKARRAPGE